MRNSSACSGAAALAESDSSGDSGPTQRPGDTPPKQNDGSSSSKRPRPDLSTPKPAEPPVAISTQEKVPPEAAAVGEHDASIIASLEGMHKEQLPAGLRTAKEPPQQAGLCIMCKTNSADQSLPYCDCDGKLCSPCLENLRELDREGGEEEGNLLRGVFGQELSQQHCCGAFASALGPVSGVHAV